jgi:hypothetical protein
MLLTDLSIKRDQLFSAMRAMAPTLLATGVDPRVDPEALVGLALFKIAKDNGASVADARTFSSTMATSVDLSDFSLDGGLADRILSRNRFSKTVGGDVNLPRGLIEDGFDDYAVPSIERLFGDLVSPDLLAEIRETV